MAEFGSLARVTTYHCAAFLARTSIDLPTGPADVHTIASGEIPTDSKFEEKLLMEDFFLSSAGLCRPMARATWGSATAVQWIASLSCAMSGQVGIKTKSKWVLGGAVLLPFLFFSPSTNWSADEVPPGRLVALLLL